MGEDSEVQSLFRIDGVDLNEKDIAQISMKDIFDNMLSMKLETKLKLTLNQCMAKLFEIIFLILEIFYIVK